MLACSQRVQSKPSSIIMIDKRQYASISKLKLIETFVKLAFLALRVHQDYNAN